MVRKILGIFGIAAMMVSQSVLAFPDSDKHREFNTGDKVIIANHNSLNLNPGNGYLKESIYLVVGVFSLKSNAEKFTVYAIEKGFPAQFSFNEDNHYYYVYLHSSNDLEDAKTQHEKVVSSTSIFPGIWLYSHKKKSAVQEHPIEQQEIDIETHSVSAQKIKENHDPQILLSSSKKLNTKVDSVKFNKKEEDYLIYPNVIFSKNYKEIKAKVQIIDPIRSKLIKTVNAHELSLLQNPNNGSHAIQLIADVFGYRKVQHDFLLNSLSVDSVSSFIFLRGDTILIEFPMERLKTGDVATMYNVFFRNDAVVMESSSQYELNSLMEMLKENENYQIVIHGHTNGNKRGKIIKLVEENPNFFVITEENKISHGSAKKLSTERALTIKKYLVSNGISEDRMKVMGWGGKKMIYDKYSVDAKKNVRVEIEILQD